MVYNSDVCIEYIFIIYDIHICIYIYILVDMYMKNGIVSIHTLVRVDIPRGYDAVVFQSSLWSSQVEQCATEHRGAPAAEALAFFPGLTAQISPRK